MAGSPSVQCRGMTLRRFLIERECINRSKRGAGVNRGSGSDRRSDRFNVGGTAGLCSSL